MNNQNKSDKWPDFRFNLEEIAGAVGDYGTLIPHCPWSGYRFKC